MSAGGDRTAEFAFYLLLIVCFQNTLLPSALFGFSTTLTAIILATWTGKQVDQHPKLFLVRCCILSQKLSSFGAYISFFFLLKHYPNPASLSNVSSLLLFLGIVVAGCVLRVSTVCIQIAIEKDWVISISEGIEGHLTTLNISLRRVDLLCNLLSPLFITYVLLALSYRTSVGVLAGITAISCIFELYWIGTVYEKFPQLQRDDDLKTQERHLQQEIVTPSCSSSWGTALRLQVRDWLEFTRMSVFLSSISVSLLYITVLSFDGNMLGYLKTQMFDDTILAAMRSTCVLTGLFGTVVAPWLEARLGSVRAGSWCIWSEVICLVPVMLSLTLPALSNTPTNSALHTTLLFGGMAASRVGLWSFDLIQVKQLQETIADHPRRNALAALQHSMQNAADLVKYTVAMALSRPSQFHWAALVSFICVLLAAITYTVYLKRERGHVLHFHPLKLCKRCYGLQD